MDGWQCFFEINLGRHDPTQPNPAQSESNRYQYFRKMDTWSMKEKGRYRESARECGDEAATRRAGLREAHMSSGAFEVVSQAAMSYLFSFLFFSFLFFSFLFFSSCRPLRRCVAKAAAVFMPQVDGRRSYFQWAYIG